MAKLSVAVAAHPKRKHLVDQMLNGPLWGVEVSVAWDDGDDTWSTHQRAWESCDPESGATHHLVLQDDAVPCRFLVPGLEMALSRSPAAPMSLYFGSALSHPKIVRAARSADECGASWIVSSGFWWGVAVLLPVSLVPAMLRFCSPRRESYDRRLTIWAEHSGYPVYYPWPSLVDHLDTDSLVTPGRRPGRKAYKFAGEEYSALSFNPTGPTVPCGRVKGITDTRMVKGP